MMCLWTNVCLYLECSHNDVCQLLISQCKSRQCNLLYVPGECSPSSAARLRFPCVDYRTVLQLQFIWSLFPKNTDTIR